VKKELPLIRKVIDLGTCKAVSLPKSWLQFFENKMGQKIEFLQIEVNGALKIKPYLPNKGKEPQ
jgi:hypothetical protein